MILFTQGYQRTKLVSTLEKVYGRHHNFVSPYNVSVSRLISDALASAKPYIDCLNHGQYFPHFFFSKSLFRLIGIVGEACLPSNAYFPWTPNCIPFILSQCLSV